MGRMLPILTSSDVIYRYNGGEPVLSKKDIPYEADCIFNAGVTKYRGQYVMAFRNDYNFDGAGAFGDCMIGLAFSENGIDWKVQEKPFITKEDLNDPDVTKVYDPRLTVIDDVCYLCFAVDTRHGVRGGIARTEDLSTIEILTLTAPDNRNMVLFPEKVGGRYVRLERPFPVYSRGGVDRFDMWISFSEDMRYWGDTRLLLGVEDVPYANDKIGPGAPPVKTDKGWLTLFHSVDIDRTRGKNGWEAKWQKRYCGGIMLLDLEDPSKVIGLYKEPLIAPETLYEVEEGFRTNVIFPGGMILEDNDEVKIYYGASDTVECLATARLEDLLPLCKSV
ncbi:beta-1,4-mannooligosaccharide/beta-1,4-mannosyl-N-acetylglucosamine phosphorylase [Anaerotaenia torta]|uniref:glycoside hydrolase family 130 protein n=1 Tax=Anaerotaenia torta TaxID=433293 RepID=UPI003D223CB1